MFAVLNWQIGIHIELHIGGGGRGEAGGGERIGGWWWRWWWWLSPFYLITHYLSNSSFLKFLYLGEAVNDIKCLWIFLTRAWCQVSCHYWIFWVSCSSLILLPEPQIAWYSLLLFLGWGTRMVNLLNNDLILSCFLTWLFVILRTVTEYDKLFQEMFETLFITVVLTPNHPVPTMSVLSVSLIGGVLVLNSSYCFWNWSRLVWLGCILGRMLMI